MIPVLRKCQNNEVNSVKNKVPLAVEASTHSSPDTNIPFQSIEEEKGSIMKKMQQCSFIYRRT